MPTTVSALNQMLQHINHTQNQDPQMRVITKGKVPAEKLNLHEMISEYFSIVVTQNKLGCWQNHFHCWNEQDEADHQSFFFFFSLDDIKKVF